MGAILLPQVYNISSGIANNIPLKLYADPGNYSVQMEVLGLGQNVCIFNVLWQTLSTVRLSLLAFYAYFNIFEVWCVYSRRFVFVAACGFFIHVLLFCTVRVCFVSNYYIKIINILQHTIVISIVSCWLLLVCNTMSCLACLLLYFQLLYCRLYIYILLAYLKRSYLAYVKVNSSGVVSIFQHCSEHFMQHRGSNLTHVMVEYGAHFSPC